MEVLLESDLPLPLFVRGKVRDTYLLGDRLLIVATDRISAFDVVLPCGIPDKGAVLNQLSAFWFRETAGLVRNHLLEVVEDVRRLDDFLPPDERFDYPAYLAGRAMVVKCAERFPIECVVRGYLAGSAWEEYRLSGTVNGVSLPVGIKESQELAEPIFTPSTKAETGHDMPMTIAEVAAEVGETFAGEIARTSISLYSFARQKARAKGLIIADTKMEFGLDGGELVLIDELLTPDSSRFWPADEYGVGHSQSSFDKQPVRDWLAASDWDKAPPAPMLSDDVIESTAEKYREAYRRLTGADLRRYSAESSR